MAKLCMINIANVPLKSGKGGLLFREGGEKEMGEKSVQCTTYCYSMEKHR